MAKNDMDYFKSIGWDKPWYREKREKKEWFLNYPDLVVSGTDGWNDRKCVYFVNDDAYLFTEPDLIDPLLDEFNDLYNNDDLNDFDTWLLTNEGREMLGSYLEKNS